MSFVNVMGKIAADNIRIERTAKITLDANGLYYVFKLPKKAYVSHVSLEILTAADAGELTVGFVGNGETADASYFMDNAAVQPTITGTRYTCLPKWFVDAGGAVTLTLSSLGSTAPVIRAFVQFSVIH